MSAFKYLLLCVGIAAGFAPLFVHGLSPAGDVPAGTSLSCSAWSDEIAMAEGASRCGSAHGRKRCFHLAEARDARTAAAAAA